MNKIVFPALLAATIMVAGAFAFMPVEQASTVHLTAAGQGVNTLVVANTIAELTPSDVFEINCSDDYYVDTLQAIYTVTAGTGGTEDATVAVTLDGETYVAATDVVTNDAVQITNLIGTGFAGTDADNVVLTFNAFTDDADEDVSFRATIVGGGTCSFTETP